MKVNFFIFHALNWKVVCVFAVYLFTLHGSLFSQVVDSPVDYQLTSNDTINQRIQKMKGFYVEIIEPILLHSSGVEVETGFESEWLYVVKSDSVWIDGERLAGSEGWPTYLVVRAKVPRITVSPEIIKGRALILKGMIDRTDSLIQFYTTDLENSRKKVDEMEASLPKNQVLNSKQIRSWDTVMTFYNNSLYFYNLYTTFKSYKKSKSKRSNFAKFFLSELFNKRNVKFALITVPLSIPLMTFSDDEKAMMKSKTKKNSEEFGLPAKNRHTKRESNETKVRPSVDNQGEENESDDDIDPDINEPESDQPKESNKKKD